MRFNPKWTREELMRQADALAERMGYRVGKFGLTDSSDTRPVRRMPSIDIGEVLETIEREGFEEAQYKGLIPSFLFPG